MDLGFGSFNMTVLIVKGMKLLDAYIAYFLVKQSDCRMGTMMYFFSLVSKQTSERVTSTMSPRNLNGSTFRKLNRGFLIICLKMQSDMCSHCMIFFCDISVGFGLCNLSHGFQID